MFAPLARRLAGQAAFEPADPRALPASLLIAVRRPDDHAWIQY
ncbi:hypothetical protein [Frankia sp. R82]|nr:hypothetical protein [Frankia sp. R82]